MGRTARVENPCWRAQAQRVAGRADCMDGERRQMIILRCKAAFCGPRWELLKAKKCFLTIALFS